MAGNPNIMATFSETFDMRYLSVATDRGKGQSEGTKISVQYSLCSRSVICLDLYIELGGITL